MRLAIAVALAAILATAAQADPISGYVKANGKPVVSSALYTVMHPKPGWYLITFATPMSPQASCVVTTFRALFVKKLVESQNGCLVVLHGAGLQHGEDGDFSFIATPMSN